MLNQWEQAIVDSLRYGLQHNKSVIISADEVHIPMNAIVQLDTLRSRLAEVERERDAAISDMKSMALSMRESEDMQESCCFACAFSDDNADGVTFGECPGFDRDDCFKWRGTEGL